jgi:hypothetical protein
LRRNSAATETVARPIDSTFDRMVDALARLDGAPLDYDPLERSFATVAPTARPDLDKTSDPTERWDEALDWITEPLEFAESARGAKPAPPSSDQAATKPADPPAAAAASPAKSLSVDPAAIAAELGLGEALSPEALNRARRRFMWENHPDRRHDLSRELANRRVAIANMLIDRALGRARGPSNGGVSRRS